jgi:hypothetical protein
MRLLASFFVHDGAIIGKMGDCSLEGDVPSVSPVYKDVKHEIFLDYNLLAIRFIQTYSAL